MICNVFLTIKLLLLSNCITLVPHVKCLYISVWLKNRYILFYCCCFCILLFFPVNFRSVVVFWSCIFFESPFFNMRYLRFLSLMDSTCVIFVAVIMIFGGRLIIGVLLYHFWCCCFWVISFVIVFVCHQFCCCFCLSSVSVVVLCLFLLFDNIIEVWHFGVWMKFSNLLWQVK